MKMKHYEINVIPPVNSVDAIDGFGLVVRHAIEKWIPDEINGCKLRGHIDIHDKFKLEEREQWCMDFRIAIEVIGPHMTSHETFIVGGISFWPLSWDQEIENKVRDMLPDILKWTEEHMHDRMPIKW